MRLYSESVELPLSLPAWGLSIDKIAQAVKVNLVTVRSWFAEMPNAVR